MLIKFLPKKEGNIRRLISYLLAESIKGVRRDPKPELLYGEPQELISLVESLPFKNKYETGVITFAIEDNPTEEQQKEVMDYFEKMAFAGMERDQYDILWVRHIHTGENRVELHFAIPCVEFNTGKNLTVSFPNSHLSYYSALRDYFNYKYDWADPNDPLRKRDIQLGYYNYIKRENERLAECGLPVINKLNDKNDIHEFIVSQINDGLIYDRDSMLLILAEAGYEINSKIEDNHITIVGNSLERPVRLKGNIYEREWRIESTIERTAKKKSNRKQGSKGQDYQRRIRELQTDLERRIGNRRKRFDQRYAKVNTLEYTDTLVYARLINRQSGESQSQERQSTEKQSSTNQVINKHDPIRERVAKLIDPIQRRLREGKARATATNEGVARFVQLVNGQIEEIVGGEERDYRNIDRIDTGVAEQSERIRASIQQISNDITRLDEAVTATSKRIVRDKEELIKFKNQINLVEYAESLGYFIHFGESSSNAIAMKNKDNDRILVGWDMDDWHYFYASISDPSDRGSIIDFIQKRSSKNLGQIRKELRPWLSRKGKANERTKPLPKLFTSDRALFSQKLMELAVKCGVVSPPQEIINEPVEAVPQYLPHPYQEIEELETPDFDDYPEPQAPDLDDDLEL